MGQTIRAVQVGRALDRIRATKQPLAEVAAECGFYDQTHMGRHVKRATGRTPGEVRKSR